MSAHAVGRLHVITDETVQHRWTHRELARFAAEGGADVVQFREKRGIETHALVAMVVGVREELRDRQTRVIVNDRVDVAAAAGADGVHLGPLDLEPEWARRLLGSSALLGGTANDLRSARALNEADLNYLGVGPVFGTTSKDHPSPTLGISGLQAIVRAVSRPVIAIGNITPERVEQVFRAGAHGVAVLSDVACNRDPARRVSELVAAIERATRAIESDESSVAG